MKKGGRIFLLEKKGERKMKKEGQRSGPCNGRQLIPPPSHLLLPESSRLTAIASIRSVRGASVGSSEPTSRTQGCPSTSSSGGSCLTARQITIATRVAAISLQGLSQEERANASLQKRTRNYKREYYTNTESVVPLRRRK